LGEDEDQERETHKGKEKKQDLKTQNSRQKVFYSGRTVIGREPLDRKKKGNKGQKTRASEGRKRKKRPHAPRGGVKK